jgi:hypothetical protein
MTAFILKIIALTSMFIDHIGAVFPDLYYSYEMRVIGRMAFPIFAFLIAEGCRHSRSMPKFLLRLGIFALISEIPFDLALKEGNINFFYDTNIFYTLFLGAASVYAYQRLKEAFPPYALYLSILPFTAAMWLANTIQSDFFAYGVAFVFTMYVIPHKKLRLAVMALFCCFSQMEVSMAAVWRLLDWLPFIQNPPFAQYSFLARADYFALVVFCLLSVLLVSFYNGKRGPGLKWLFYLFYPVHLAVLAVVGL